MARVLRMPGVAAGTEAAVLGQWLVAESADFAAADPIATVETDKAAVEVEAEAAGRLLTTLVPAGAEVAVGDPIAVLGDPGEEVDDLPALLASLGVDDPPDATVPDRGDRPTDPGSAAPLVEEPEPSPLPRTRPGASSPARWPAGSRARPAWPSRTSRAPGPGGGCCAATSTPRSRPGAPPPRRHRRPAQRPRPRTRPRRHRRSRRSRTRGSGSSRPAASPRACRRHRTSRCGPRCGPTGSWRCAPSWPTPTPGSRSPTSSCAPSRSPTDGCRR